MSTPLPPPQAVAVYCASSLGHEPAYTHAAQSLGNALAAEDRGLVYGGGAKGLMGVVSNTVLQAGGSVTGVMPYAMVLAGGEHEQVANGTAPEGVNKVDMVVVGSMHERKMEMARRSAAFVCLPGGFGTFEEILEAACWEQLGIHSKPIIIVNVLGFFDTLRLQIRRGVKEGFIAPDNEHIIHFVDGPAEHSAHPAFDWGNATIQALNTWKPRDAPQVYDWTVQQTGDGKTIHTDALEAS